MMITGIHTLEQLERNQGRRWFGYEKDVCLSLYAQTDDPILRQRVLLQFAGTNRAFKRTYQNRFPAFDNDCARLIDEHLTGPRFSVHDVGVSDGCTAVDFYQLLCSQCVAIVDYTASDAQTSALCLTRLGGQCSVVIDSAGTLLQVTMPPFVFNTRRPPSAVRFPVNRLLVVLAEYSYARILIQAWRKRDPCVEVQHISLISESCERLAAQDKTFHLVEYDILSPSLEKYNVVRAMNILNPSYFSPSALVAAVKQLKASLTPGGLLIVGSNQDPGSPVRATVFAQGDEGLVALRHWNGGAPIRSILLAEGEDCSSRSGRST